MKTTKFMATVFFLFLFATSTAQGYKTAVGVRFSSNDAVVNHSLSLKHFFRETVAIEAMASFVKPYAIGVLIEKHHSLTNPNFTWFWGAGAYTGFSEGKYFGAQGALGLDLKIPDVPINISLDWKPELNLINKTFFEPAAVGLTARFTLQ